MGVADPKLLLLLLLLLLLFVTLLLLLLLLRHMTPTCSSYGTSDCTSHQAGREQASTLSTKMKFSLNVPGMGYDGTLSYDGTASQPT